MSTQLNPPSSSAIVDVADELVKRYLADGWTQVGAADEQEEKAKPFSQLNKSELEQAASDEGVDISGAKTNDEIRDAIKAHREAQQ